MKLAKAQFDNAVMAYATSELFPLMGDGWKTWLMAGGLPLMLPQVHTMLEQFALEDAQGVDVDALEVFMTNAFKAQPKLEIPLMGLGFEKGDGEKLIARLKNNKTNIF